MRNGLFGSLGAIVAAGFGLAVLAPPVPAQDITVADPFHFRDRIGQNPYGIATGDRPQVGVTTMTGATSAQGIDPLGASHNLSLSGGAATFRYNNSGPLNGAWTLNFQSATDTASVTTPDIIGAPLLSFATSVRAQPVPGGTRIFWQDIDGSMGARIQILDAQANPVQTNHVWGVVHNEITFANQTMTRFCSNGCGILVSPMVLRVDAPAFFNSNVLSRSRTYFSLARLPQQIPAQGIVLPTLLANGTFTFNVAITQDTPVFLDPTVAVGYNFAIGAGDPNFRSVRAPVLGDPEFDLYLFENGNWMFVDDLLAGELYDFGVAGVDRFRLAGIDPSLMLDPENPTAFITEVTFVADGQFTGSMTPIVAEFEVPEPGALALLAAGLGLLPLARRRRTGGHRAGETA